MNKIYMARWIKPDFEAGEAACEFIRSFHGGKAGQARCSHGIRPRRICRKGKRRKSQLRARARLDVVSPSRTVSGIRCDASHGGKQQHFHHGSAGWRMRYAALKGEGCADWDTDELSSTEYAVIAALEVTYTDGTGDTLLTDGDWSARETKWRVCNIYNGDVYDASYDTEDKTHSVKVLSHTRSILVPQEGEIICEHERLKPTEVIHTPKGETVLDFGQNMTGYVELSLSVPAGEKIVIDHAEVLDRDGNFYTENLRSAEERIVFIGDGKRHLWKPEFTFYGFRYIRLTEWHGEVNPDDFTAVVVHSDIERTGDFECSDARINQLYHNIIWGQKSNFLDVPTDCPQRDERLGWTGDAQVFARCAAYNFNVDRFFHKWLSDMTLDQRHTGAIPHVIPNIGWASPSAGWADACVIIPWQMYLLYGDRELLRRQYVTIKRWIDYQYEMGDDYIRSGQALRRLARP